MKEREPENVSLMKKLKYDVYKGTKKAMQESGGVLLLKKQSYAQVKQFCNEEKLDFAEFIDGFYIEGYWLKEAMNYK